MTVDMKQIICSVAPYYAAPNYPTLLCSVNKIVCELVSQSMQYVYWGWMEHDEHILCDVCRFLTEVFFLDVKKATKFDSSKKVFRAA